MVAGKLGCRVVPEPVGASEEPDGEPPTEAAPILHVMQAWQEPETAWKQEDTPAYRALLHAGLLTTSHRKRSLKDVFTSSDLPASSSKFNDLQKRCIFGYYCCPVLGCWLYKSSHLELFVPAGHIGLLMGAEQEYLFAEPGMHNIASCFATYVDTQPVPESGCLIHGNRTILVVKQGFVGLGIDNGQPVLFPPGIHSWTSETLRHREALSLERPVLELGPYTLLTVDEGYVAITQNNGKQEILKGGHTWLLTHKNWRFEKFLTLKIQTDDLEQILATTADNLTVVVTSTVLWRIANPLLAATLATETMAIGVSADITNLRRDVLKQAIASLASFIGSINYSDGFHVAALVQRGHRLTAENPLWDGDRLTSCVAHANSLASTYGVEILSINVLSCLPIDIELTKALAAGAVASAQALKAETASRGNANALRIEASAHADQAKIQATGAGQAEVTRAQALGEAARLVASGNREAGLLLATNEVAVELVKIGKSCQMLEGKEKFFFGQEPCYLSSLVLKEELPYQEKQEKEEEEEEDEGDEGMELLASALEEYEDGG